MCFIVFCIDFATKYRYTKDRIQEIRLKRISDMPGNEHKLQSVYKKEKMIMSNEMKQKAVKAVPNRWFVFCVLTLSGGIAFKLSSMKDMFYVPMQQFMRLTNTQIGGALSCIWNCADHWPDHWYLYL